MGRRLTVVVFETDFFGIGLASLPHEMGGIVYAETLAFGYSSFREPLEMASASGPRGVLEIGRAHV